MKVYAHRGCSGRYPENTMLAFQKAYETGCYGIELDVQMTKDGELVIIHDESVDRTTDGTGWVRDFTLADLRKLNAAKLHSKEGDFQAIPTFDEYCAWAQDKPLVTNIELKTSVFYYTGIEDKTLDMVKKYHLEERVVFSSFNHLSVIRIKQLAPEIPCGALVEHCGLGNAGAYCKLYGFEYFHPGYKALDDAAVAECKEHGIGLNVWTVNDMGDLEQLYEWGAESAITNYPEVALAWVKSVEK